MGDTSNLEVLRDTALPTLGNNKIWCYDIEHLRSYRNLNKHTAQLHNPANNLADLLTRITTNSPTATTNYSTILAEAYNDQLESIIKEKQNSSDITTKLTTTVTKEIYTKINTLLRTIYSAENMVYDAFSNTSYNNGYEESVFEQGEYPYSITRVTNPIKNSYKGFFSENEVLNVFELRTPFQDNLGGSEPTLVHKANFTSNRLNINTENIRGHGIETDRILFSSYGLNESITDRSEFSSREFYTLVQGNTSVENKPKYEYGRDFGLEAIIHSKMLASLSRDGKLRERALSSGFIITRDNYETITGLIFYATLIIPRPYYMGEAEYIREYSSNHGLFGGNRAYLDNAESIINEQINNPGSRYNPNQRQLYIAISSRFNLFDLIEYYPIRQSIVDSNLVTVLANTFNTLNGVRGFDFTTQDDTWQFGLPSEYRNLRCVSSQTNPHWNGKLISECKLLEHANLDYPAYMFRIISSINRQFEINTLVNGQRIVSVEELGDDKYIVMINVIVQRVVNSDGTSTTTYSFQTKEIQYSNLFPAVLLYSDVEISGELVVKNTAGTNLMKIDPIKNTTNFFTKVGINQPSYETNSYLDINNLSRNKVSVFVNELALAVERSNTNTNNINIGNVSNRMASDMVNVNVRDIVFTIPLKQYKSLPIPQIILNRAARMRQFTARIEGPFVVLAMERIVTKIAEAKGKITINNDNLTTLYKEKAYYERLEFWLAVVQVALDILGTVLVADAAGISKLSTRLIIDAFIEGVKSTIQNIDWSSIAKGQSDVIKNASDNLDMDDYDNGAEICQALIDKVNENTATIRAEIDRLETEYAELEARLDTFAELNAKKTEVKSNQTIAKTLNDELDGLEQEQTILNYILVNKHTVVNNIVDTTTTVLVNGQNLNPITSYSKTDASGIIMGTDLLETITSQQIDQYTNLLTNETTIETFKIQYIDNMPSEISSNSLGPNYNTIPNYNKLALTKMYDYVSGTNGRDETSLQVDKLTTPVLTYIRTIYLPWVVSNIETAAARVSQLHNSNAQFVFEPLDNTGSINNTRASIANLVASKRTALNELDYWTVFKESALRMYNNPDYYSLILYPYVGSGTSSYGPRKYIDAKLITGIHSYRFAGDSGGYRDGIGAWETTRVGSWRNSYVPNGNFVYQYKIDQENANIASINAQLESANSRLETLNIDELQTFTRDFGFNADSHNRIRNYVNNVWQLYVNSSYSSIAKDENYTVYANLADTDESNVYAINMSILYEKDVSRPSVMMTCSYFNTDNYINDLSYRSKYFEITNELNGTSELVNYATVIFKKYLSDIIEGRKTISGIISSDNLFPNRFNCKSYITIDNLTDNKVVCDELNTQWNNQSFNNITLAGTTTTLNEAYTNLLTSYVEYYNEIKYNFNYLVEYMVDGVARLSIIRFIKVLNNNSGTTNVSTPGLFKVYRITSTIDIESIVVRGMSINGDAYIDGNFYINADNEIPNPLFTVDVYNKTNTNKLKVGIGKTPTNVLDITDTTISKILKMDYNVSNNLYIINNLIYDNRFRPTSRVVRQLTEYVNANPSTESYFYLHELPLANATTGRFEAMDIKILYYGTDASWNGYTYNEIMTIYPGMREQIETNILPAFQKILDNYLLYPTAICTSTTNFIDGIMIDYYRIFDTFNSSTTRRPLLISNGNKVTDYNIDTTYTSSMNNAIEYTQKQTRFMNYVKKINNTSNIVRDQSGSEVNVHNVERNEAAVNQLTTQSILDDIDVYLIKHNTDSTESRVSRITDIRTDLSNNNVNGIDYSSLVPNSIEVSQITTQISSLTYDTRREYSISFVDELLKQYNNNILATARTRDSGMIIYKVGYTYYRSMYHVIKRGTDIFVYSFYMNYSDYIGHHVNINGDTRMEGSLSIINEYNNKSHVIINPLNKYVGVNTEQMVINYADKYATTTSRYNASHNLVVYNDKYPNAVFARTAEPTETAVINNADYKYFGSYSGLTVQRASDLYVFDHESSFMTNVASNNSQNYSITDGIMTPSNWNNYKHYGADISFELRNRNGVTKELGQVKMVIDRIDGNNNIHAGFGVQVVDNTLEGDVIEDKIKNLMYVNSDRQLFVDGVVLGGKILKVDENGNLKWGDTVIVPATTP